MSSKANTENDKKISKKCSYLLRHGALKSGLNIQPDGFVKVQEILRLLPNCTIDDITRVVEQNDKQRFTLKTIHQNLMIKANQGHSIAIVNSLDLKLLDEISFSVIHGTYFAYYEKIKKQGLSCMKRNHIHFAKGLNFLCGLRANAEIFIYIDTVKAKNDGLQFYESKNGVVLSPGNANGYIEPKYFLKVVNRIGNILKY